MYTDRIYKSVPIAARLLDNNRNGATKSIYQTLVWQTIRDKTDIDKLVQQGRRFFVELVVVAGAYDERNSFTSADFFALKHRTLSRTNNFCR